MAEQSEPAARRDTFGRFRQIEFAEFDEVIAASGTAELLGGPLTRAARPAEFLQPIEARILE